HDDSNHERTMEQQSDRRNQDNEYEHSSRPSGAKSDLASERAAFDDHRQSLNGEERGRAAVTAASGDRDHDIVNDAAEQKSDEHTPTRSEPRGTWSKQKPMRQIPERGVPATAPEFAQARRRQRPVHQRTRLHADASPRTGEQMERPEMQDQ